MAAEQEGPVEPEQTIEDYCAALGHPRIYADQIGTLWCPCGAYGEPTGPPIIDVQVKGGLL